MSPMVTPAPTVATPFSVSVGIAPTTAFSPMVTFSATMQCFTVAPALITVPPMITASSMTAPFSTLTPEKRMECFTLPLMRQPSVIIEFSTTAPALILCPVIPLLRLKIFQSSSNRLIPLCSGSRISIFASQREDMVPTSFQ